MLPDLAQLFARDLDRFSAQLELYPDDAAIWRVPEGIHNSAGTLALHTVGNLNHFIGLDLGQQAYTRNREAEFAERDLPRSDLLSALADTRQRVQTALTALDPAKLEQPFPRTLPNFPPEITTAAFLLHLYGHLNWHLGQVDYHRRLSAPAAN